MRFYGKKTLTNTARLLRSRFVRHGLILGYHRIAWPVADPYGVCTSPTYFRQHLEYLSRRATVLPLAELCRARAAERIEPRSVAITFDDGHIDNFRVARPLLQEYEMPATFFITTGYIGGELWWDRLVRMLDSCDDGEELEIRIDGVGYALNRERKATREEQIRNAYRLLLPLETVQRMECLSQLEKRSRGSNLPHDYRAVMNETEIKTLSDDGFSIGSHTVSHPLLAELRPDEQRAEIEQSKHTLESILGEEVKEFAYPNGSRTEQTVAIVIESGFELACASHRDIVWRRSDPHALPRLWPADRSGRELELWLGGWL